MKFPRPTIRVGTCLAIWKRKIGHRPTDGPCTKGRKQIMHDGEPWKPSRLAYHLNVAPISRTPPSLRDGLVLHTCDHEWCVEPAHLYFGTQLQNVIDMYQRHPTIRQKMSATRKDRPLSEQHRKAIGLGNLGKTNSPQAREKISAKAKQRLKLVDPETMKQRMKKLAAARWGA